jgi:hypothetical protein
MKDEAKSGGGRYQSHPRDGVIRPEREDRKRAEAVGVEEASGE